MLQLKMYAAKRRHDDLDDPRSNVECWYAKQYLLFPSGLFGTEELLTYPSPGQMQVAMARATAMMHLPL